jgi:sulfite exporter TauE/SafE
VAALCTTAVSVGVLHTILGPDHYVPFVAMSRAGGWSSGKTLRVTLACGLGHVAGSVAIGVVGLLLGVAVLRLESLEAFRGDAAGWLLIALGLACCMGPFLRAHRPAHEGCPPAAARPGPAAGGVWSPWLLFLIFVFGPCEPLIPLLMYPAAKASPLAVAAVVAVFAGATVVTMTAAVFAVRSGAGLVGPRWPAPVAHALAGLAVLACGVLIKLGL